MSDKEDLRKIATNMLPDPIIVIGYLEHQLDLIAQLVLDLHGSQTDLSPEVQSRLDKLKELMDYSSIDFTNLDAPLEAYKLPNATNLKKGTRRIQKQYLQAQIREGVFNK